ncbi:4'-phosphopantetheinyl transferase superfamily protein [Vibrio sp.]|nr:4'-phosphopantetheinyl transferase superfamily protein [Vibrio sp.]
MKKLEHIVMLNGAGEETLKSIVVAIASQDMLDGNSDFNKGRVFISHLLDGLGYLENFEPIPRLPHGAPLWPKGFVGSISHCQNWIIGILCRSVVVERVGIDIERVRPLVDMNYYAPIYLSKGEERMCLAVDWLATEVVLTLAFSAKETAMKAFSCPLNEILPFDSFEIKEFRPCSIQIVQYHSPSSKIKTREFSIHWEVLGDYVVTCLLHSRTFCDFQLCDVILPTLNSSQVYETVFYGEKLG